MTRTTNVNRSRAAATWTTNLAIQICHVIQAPAMDLQAASNRAAPLLKTDTTTDLQQTSEVLQIAVMIVIHATEHPSDTWIHQLKLVSVTARLFPARMFGIPVHRIKRSVSVTMPETSGIRSQKLQLGATTTIATTDLPVTTENKSFQHRSSSIRLRHATISSLEVPTSFQAVSVTIATTPDDSKLELKLVAFCLILIKYITKK